MYKRQLIGQYLIDNPHRVTVILEPDAGLNRRLEEEERARLDAARATMSDAEAQTVIDQARELMERQNTPDAPEVLATLPSLGREDLDKQHKVIPIRVGMTAGEPVSYTHLDVYKRQKVRAMEIIEALEGQRRGLYAGAVGYFSYDGSMDTCIAIRTMVMQGDSVSVQAGAGIVADSEPAAEYQESVNKASALLVAVARAEAGTL